MSKWQIVVSVYQILGMAERRVLHQKIPLFVAWIQNMRHFFIATEYLVMIGNPNNANGGLRNWKMERNRSRRRHRIDDTRNYENASDEEKNRNDSLPCFGVPVNSWSPFHDYTWLQAHFSLLHGWSISWDANECGDDVVSPPDTDKACRVDYRY